MDVRSRDIVPILFRHRGKVLLVTGVVLVAATAGILFRSRSYESTAKLLVRLGRESLAIDPTATTSDTMASVRLSQDHEVNSILQILQSRTIAELVVDDLGSATVLGEDKKTADQGSNSSGSAGTSNIASMLQQTKSALSSVTGRLQDLKSALKQFLPSAGETMTERDRAIEAVLSYVEFSSPKMSTIILIKCRGPDPRLAQRIVEAWTKAFFREHLRLTRTEGSFAFFQEELQATEGQLTEAERKLSEFKIETHLLSVDSQRQVLATELGVIAQQLLKNNSAMAAADAKMQVLQAEVDSTPEEIKQSPTAVSKEAWDRMRERLYELQIQEKNLKSLYFEEHPNVIAIENQRKEVEALLMAEPGTEDLELTLLTERATLAGLRAEQDVIRKQQTSILARVDRLNSDAERMTGLERAIASLEARYQTQASKLEEARVHQELVANEISSTNLLQTASYIAEPTGLSTTKRLAFACVVAMLSGLATAVLFEHFSSTFASPTQVEQKLNIPVLAVVPRGRSGKTYLPAERPGADRATSVAPPRQARRTASAAI